MEPSGVAPPRPRTTLRKLAPLTRPRPADPAFERLYRAHARDVYHYALALLTNPADAEDVTQTTFLNAYRALQRGERPRRPHSWLITIAHNVCRMRWRQAQSRPSEVPLDDAPEPVAFEQERPDLDEVLRALAQLSFNQRAALVMRELEGRSYRQIADVLGLSVGAVEALLFRARQRLRLQRRGLGVLTTVPLPGSLSSFGGAGGGVVAAGGAAFGADAILKAAAVVVAGAVTAGVGYRSVQAVAGPSRSALMAPKPQAMQQRPREAALKPAQHARAKRSAPARGTLRAARPAGPRTSRIAEAPPSQPPSSVPDQEAIPAEATTPAEPGAPATAASSPQTVGSTLASTSPLPLPQTAPPPPVSLPLPPAPPLPVTVTTPTLPLPPPPKLP
jgi:RNA polymerase sigma-70 factor, ECF subfamily